MLSQYFHDVSQIPDAVADAPLLVPYVRTLSLHCLPEIVRIEVFRELRVNVQHVDITFFRVADRRLIVVACLILFQSNTQRPVKPES
jgi:hypothetical protein